MKSGAARYFSVFFGYHKHSKGIVTTCSCSCRCSECHCHFMNNSYPHIEPPVRWCGSQKKKERQPHAFIFILTLVAAGIESSKSRRGTLGGRSSSTILATSLSPGCVSFVYAQPTPRPLFRLSFLKPGQKKCQWKSRKRDKTTENKLSI